MEEEIRTVNIGDFFATIKGMAGFSDAKNNVKKPTVQKEKEVVNPVKVSEKEEEILSQNLDDKNIEPLIEDGDLEKDNLTKDSSDEILSIYSVCEKFLTKENLEEELKDFYASVDPDSKELEMDCIKAIQKILTPEKEEELKLFFRAEMGEV